MISRSARGQLLRRGRRVDAGVGDAEAAAEVELGQRGAGPIGELGVQAQRPSGRDLEALGVEDLRADVGVDPGQVQRRLLEAGLQRLGRRAAGDGEAELLVLVGGGDVLVGVRLDARGDPHHHPRPYAQLGGQLTQPGDLGERVDNDPPDTGGQRLAELGDALVVAVQADTVQVHPGPLDHGQLAAGADVDAQPLLAHPAGDRGAQEGLGRVVDVPAGEGLGEGPGPRPQVGLVQHVRRRADLFGDLGGRDPGDGEDTVGILVHATAPQRGQQPVDVVGDREPAGCAGGDVGMDRAGDMGMGHARDCMPGALRAGLFARWTPRPALVHQQGQPDQNPEDDHQADRAEGGDRAGQPAPGPARRRRPPGRRPNRRPGPGSPTSRSRPRTPRR